MLDVPPFTDVDKISTDPEIDALAGTSPDATSDGTAASAATRQDRPPRPPARWRKTRPRLSPFPLKPPAACRTHAPDQVITRPTDSAA